MRGASNYHLFAMSGRLSAKKERIREWAFAGALGLAVTLAFFPVLYTEFTELDDPEYVIDNPIVKRGLSWDGLWWGVTSVHGSNWHPLTSLSHMVDVQLYGLEPAGHHLTSLLVHALAAMLLFAALLQTFRVGARSRHEGSAPLFRCGFVAALFALHPTRVESVAWVAERKDVLSGLFFAITLFTYARYAERTSWQRFIVMGAFLALGLMSKPILVTVPFVLLLLDYWPLGRLESLDLRRPDVRRVARRLLVEKIPLFALCLASGAATLLAQQRGGAVQPFELLPALDRIANASISSIEYLRIIVFPFDLSPMRLLNERSGSALLTQALAAAGALTLISLLILRYARRAPYLLVGWVWYLVTLAPVVGLVQVGWQSTADRYTYIPLVGIALAIAWGAMDLAWRLRIRRSIPAAAALALLLACGLVTFRQAPVWRDSFSLAERALATDPDNYVALTLLGRAWLRAGDENAAGRAAAAAVRAQAAFAPSLSLLGRVRLGQGRLDEAEEVFRELVDLRAGRDTGHAGLAAVEWQRGRLEAALHHLSEAAAIEPRVAEYREGIGDLLLRMGRWDEAIDSYQLALLLDPEQFSLWRKIARTRIRKASALAEKGEVAAALAEYRRVLDIPGSQPWLDLQIAWVLATHPDPRLRDGAQAQEIAARACDSIGEGEPRCLDIRAAVQAEMGHFEAAAALLTRALERARARGRLELAVQLEQRLALYRMGRPYREPRAGESVP